MMTEIRLNGLLGKRCGRIWKLDVSSVSEACHAINVLTRGAFNKAIIDEKDETQGYHVQVGEQTIDEGMLAFHFNRPLIRITPVFQGADVDAKSIVSIVAGVALIAVGIVAGAAGYLGPFAPAVVGLGLSLALGGVARLLTSAPPQTIGTQDKTKSSYIFGGAVNTVQQGECVPLCYGNPWTGSAVGSAGMSSVDINV